MLEKLPEFVGHALLGRRAGLDSLLVNEVHLNGAVFKLEVSSPAFAPEGVLPVRFTTDGAGIAPPLHWGNVPDKAVSLVLIIEDADSPTGEPFVHAIAVDLDPLRVGIAEGELNESDGAAIKLGRNSYLQKTWLPFDPPPGHGVHRYAFQLFALAEGKPFSNAPGRKELAEAIRDRAIAVGCLIGTYERSAAIKVEPSAALPADSAGVQALMGHHARVAGLGRRCEGSVGGPGGRVEFRVFAPSRDTLVSAAHRR